MPINALHKDSPRGRGPEPDASLHAGIKDKPPGEEEKVKEGDLAAQEVQALWESQEVGNTSWSGESGTRYSDPE